MVVLANNQCMRTWLREVLAGAGTGGVLIAKDPAYSSTPGPYLSQIDKEGVPVSEEAPSSQGGKTGLPIGPAKKGTSEVCHPISASFREGGKNKRPGVGQTPGLVRSTCTYDVLQDVFNTPTSEV